MPDQAIVTKEQIDATEQRLAAEQKSAEETKKQADDPRTKEVEELRAKYTELENVTRGAVKRAESSEAYVQQLTASLQGAAEKVVASREHPEQQPTDIREQLAENPMAVLDAHFQARTAPLVSAVTENHARMNRDMSFMKFQQEKIPGTDKSLASVYGEEVDAFLKEMQPGTKAQAGVYEAAMRWVRSQHVDDEVNMRLEAARDAEKRSFVEAPTSAGAAGVVKKTLSDLEKQVAKGLGLTEEEYREYRDMGA